VAVVLCRTWIGVGGGCECGVVRGTAAAVLLSKMLSENAGAAYRNQAPCFEEAGITAPTTECLSVPWCLACMAGDYSV
jgi:hypothetical protein